MNASAPVNYTLLLEEYNINTCTLTTCPIVLANIHYVPSLAGNASYLAVFVFLLLVHIGLGIRFRTWGFLAGMTGGLILEIIGYAARIGMHNNQFIKTPFFTYLVTLTIAPAFLSASIYLCLARIVAAFGAHLSRFKPRTYTLVFVSCDLVSLVLQALGGAIAAGANTPDQANLGQNLMLAGLVFQVVSLVVFSLLCIDFMFRVKKQPSSRNINFAHVTSTTKFHCFLYCLAIATVAIIIRSSFRVAELMHGFTSEIANNQAMFMALEGPMIMLAVAALAAFHPGFAFSGEWQAASWSFRTKKDEAAYSLTGKDVPSMDSRGYV